MITSLILLALLQQQPDVVHARLTLGTLPTPAKAAIVQPVKKQRRCWAKTAGRYALGGALRVFFTNDGKVID
jgi:hypothetical protein